MMTHTVTQTIVMDAADVSWGSPELGYRRIVAVGSGREGLAEPQSRDALITLQSRVATRPSALR